MTDQTTTMAMKMTARMLKEHPGQPTAGHLVAVAVVAEDVVDAGPEQPPTRGLLQIHPADSKGRHDIHSVC